MKKAIIILCLLITVTGHSFSQYKIDDIRYLFELRDVVNQGIAIFEEIISQLIEFYKSPIVQKLKRAGCF